VELRLLINSHCPIISVESSEEDRFAVMLWCVAADIGVALCLWSATEGLSRAGGTALYNCDQPEQALANMATIQGDAVFLLKDLCVIARTTRSAGFCAIWRTDFAPRRSIVLLAARSNCRKSLRRTRQSFNWGCRRRSAENQWAAGDGEARYVVHGCGGFAAFARMDCEEKEPWTPEGQRFGLVPPKAC
jgi:hypothetical protein